MRILFLSQLLPLPLDAGPKIRAYYVLRYLAEAGHAVTLLSFMRPGDRAEDVGSLGRYCDAVETVPLQRSRLEAEGVVFTAGGRIDLARFGWRPRGSIPKSRGSKT